MLHEILSANGGEPALLAFTTYGGR